MLEQLHIKNVALIEEVEIFFGKGLNILSGETGAGKSMVIDAVNFVLGERTNRDFIRRGEDHAMVEALFMIDSSEIKDILADQGIQAEEDGTILIKRTLYSNGKTQNKINGDTVTVGMLKKLSQTFIDIHGQHEHQSLLNPTRHIELLDRFCAEELSKPKEKLTSLYNKYKELNQEIEKLSGDERQRAQKLDLLQFQEEEISQADLKPGEEDTLYERRKCLFNSDKLKKLSSTALELIEADHASLDQISEVMGLLEDLKEIDEKVTPVFDLIESIYAQLDEAKRQLSRYSDNIESDPAQIDALENRLTVIYGLKRKYGNSVSEILEFYETVVQDIQNIKSSEKTLQLLLSEKKEIKKEVTACAEQISQIRKRKALEIQTKIQTQLWDLEMKNASFEIRIEQKNDWNQDGWDKVEFLISANLGEERKPLAKIASGGEMSRVMLALKTVLAGADHIETFIFDEIDTGVSGRTAQKVAEKMATIAKQHQIICITHLPQIACMADNHYLIEKQVEKNQTITQVYELNSNKTVDEIARLVGGTKITDATMIAAREMKMLADELKRTIKK